MKPDTIPSSNLGSGFDRILVVDGSVSRRALVARELGRVGYTVPVESVDELERFWPDVPALLVVGDEHAQVADTVRVMNRTENWMPMVAFSENPTVDMIVETLHAGALDYWQLPLPVTELGQRVAEVERRAAPVMARRNRRARARARMTGLTPREREVMSQFSLGYSNKEVSQALGISPRTVEVHRANILDRMKANSFAEAVRVMLEATID